MNEDPLASPVRYIRGVGPERARALEEAGIHTVLDLLFTFPRKHLDRAALDPVAMVREGVAHTLMGTVRSVKERYTRKRRFSIIDVGLRDDTGEIPVRFFNQRFLKRSIRVDDTMIVTGSASSEYGLHFKPTEFEILKNEDADPIHAAGVVPSYSIPEGFGRKGFRQLMWNTVKENVEAYPEILPAALRKKRKLMDGPAALSALHFPADAKELDRARTRMAYEELFLLQVMMGLRKLGVREEKSAHPLRISKTLDFRIRSRFPFKLTKAQERVVDEIRGDLVSGRPMNRLLQGDVGAGKTIVAGYAILASIGNHAQAAIMAPTEILAEQHLRTFTALLRNSRVRIAFLGRRTKAKKDVLASIAAGEVDLVVGTHAVIQKDVRFHKLAVAVVDEQQKFGVMQRAALRLKGDRPHVLVMTATPIPRTLTLTLFGDLDVSVIDQLPPGRKPVRTFFRPREKQRDVFEFVRRKVQEGRQAYIVYPLVDESDKLALKAATEMHGHLEKFFKGMKVGLLHGKMKPEEKDGVMTAFRGGDVQILVSTIVVEVGIDVPNATVMVIDHGERYGLSQLHQLRGRIGRGEYDSTCFVLSEKRTERLKAFTATTDGFKIAEADLKIRGPGEMLGTRQSGLPELCVADLLTDTQLIGWARDDARKFLKADPVLATPPAPALRRMLQYRFGKRISLATVG